MATPARGDDDPKPRRVLSRVDNPLVRAVGRVPATLQVKLLVAFVGTVVLLVIMGVLGLRVIGDSNDRIVTLGALQQRATAYRDLQTTVAAVLRGLAGRAGICSDSTVNNCSSAAPVSGLPALDRTITSAVLDLDKATDPARLGFVPPDDEQSTLTQIGPLRIQLSDVMRRITRLDGDPFDASVGDAHSGLLLQLSDADPLADRLKDLTDTLVNSTQADTTALIELNRSSFAASQNLLIGVALGSIMLALLLGLVLSWSITGPIRRMETRLAAIASGDFAGHVEVSNRDELGALAVNLNQMNDELGRLYEALETASRHKSEFLANMSHELRTPLNAIIGFSQVLQQQMFGELNAKQADYVDDVLSSGQHLLNLINDILDLAKVEAGRMELQPTSFALPEVLENALSMVRERATRQGVSLSTAIDASVGPFEGDERKVKQIIFNLLSNAVKFTPDGGQVKLAAKVLEQEVEISVRDTGVGISAEDQVKIFEEFYQVGHAKTQEGTGLGLALTRRLVELHHGHLGVASQPGVGSTFTVTLPLHQPAPATEIASASAGGSTP